MEIFCLYHHPKRLTTVFSDSHLGRVGVIDPIDTGLNVERGAVRKMFHSLLQGTEGVGRMVGLLQLTIEQKVMAVKGLRHGADAEKRQEE